MTRFSGDVIDAPLSLFFSFSICRRRVERFGLFFLRDREGPIGYLCESLIPFRYFSLFFCIYIFLFFTSGV